MDATAVIVAVASPPGRSARGIVRISGARAFELLEPLLQRAGDHGGTWQRGLHCARLACRGHALPCLALVMPAPHSYTAENAIELQPPGNPALLETVVDELLAAARSRAIEARRADPGEFTARAYWNGKIGLTEAEGVAATIAARSDAELRAAHLLTDGRLATLARRAADELASTLALVEAGIDFTDQEDVVPIGPRTLHARIARIETTIDRHLSRAVGLEELEAIPWTVIAGPPNAGKSTLFNALLGRRRAVVSAVAGTTRDVLAEPLLVETDHGAAEVMLVDLAGLDEGDSVLDRWMRDRAHDALARAELVLWCEPAGADASAGNVPSGAVRVATKADLTPPGRAMSAAIAVSATTGAGLTDLCVLIARRLSTRAVSLAADATALLPRHETALRSAAEHLAETRRLLEGTESEHALPEPELLAAGLRAALDAMGSLAGDVTPDDVLGRIFSTFCVGK